MKLKSIAALIIRFVGAALIIGSIQALSVGIDTHNIIAAMIEAVISFIVGCGLIYYSKKLGALFCKGLEDDDTV